jgi:antitoxin (DNA-binding transcriptional repressor) of toxin-antitoxin stability system
VIKATMHAAKTQLSKLVELALEGEEVILTRGRAKTPAVRLVPVEKPTKRQRPIGLFKGQIDIGPEFFEPLPEDEMAAWEASEKDRTLLGPQ